MDQGAMARTKQGFAAHAGELLNGGSFHAFLRKTEDTWRSLAGYLMRKWKAPADVELEDVVQELKIGAFVATGRYDAEREGAAEFHSYLVWNACDKAKKKIHKWRGAYLHRNADNNPGRYAQPMSEVDPDGLILQRLGCEAAQIEDLDYRRTWDTIARAMPTARLCWATAALAVSRGQVDAAARALYENVELRTMLRLKGEAAALRAVEQAMAVAYEMPGAMRSVA